MSKKLPLGLQDFRKIIEGGYRYIDKTAYIHQMCKAGSTYFLSRPRRFGKSITVSLLDELYSGSQELFEGLWIADKWDWSKRHPVIRISFKDLNFEQRGLEEVLAERLQEIAKENHLQLEQKAARDRFRELIRRLGEAQKVVVLVDEYDAPIVHYLGKDIAQAYTYREYLKGFYSVLKEGDPYLEFVFLTGVSKFSKVGIFSGLNNLTDLSLHPDYACMLGYTQAELVQNFAEELEASTQYHHLDKAQLLDKIRYWYNGYRFAPGAETVYNPVSINQFFFEKNFRNYWFATGTPTFLINIIKQEGLYTFKTQPQSETSFDNFDLEDLHAFGLLYQTGYLTIKSKNEFGEYELDYPNYEVKHSMETYLLEAFAGESKISGPSMAIQLEKAFLSGNLEQAIRILQGLFKGLPYFVLEKYPEKFFHAAIHLLFSYIGIKVQSEVCTSDGRVDSLVETPTHVYILEYKLDESAEVALEQIRHKQYYQAYWHKNKPVIGVGVNFSSATKNIDDWKMEVMSG